MGPLAYIQINTPSHSYHRIALFQFKMHQNSFQSRGSRPLPGATGAHSASREGTDKRKKKIEVRESGMGQEGRRASTVVKP